MPGRVWDVVTGSGIPNAEVGAENLDTGDDTDAARECSCGPPNAKTAVLALSSGQT